MSPWERVSLDSARTLLDLSGRRPGWEAIGERQLEGAVALHNLLATGGFACCADEVGMGKTYVALAVAALVRHVRPEARILFVAPRGNLQKKWLKEMRAFAAQNVRRVDHRVRSLQDAPVRPVAWAENLIQLAEQAAVDPDRDFLARISSFSFGLSSQEPARRWTEQWTRLRRYVPTLPAHPAPEWLSRKDTFKDAFAQALNVVLPSFDLVIVDECHNLKHGFQRGVAARNRMLALALGRPPEGGNYLFPGQGPRATRVLGLSATPVETDFVELWNQLDVFGLGGHAPGLRDRALGTAARKQVAKGLVVRRLNRLDLAGQSLTKNQYRREWREGGVQRHDERLAIADDRSRLAVALVQKKVSDVLTQAGHGRGDGRLLRSFQMGMLASFESFLETTRAKQVQQKLEEADALKAEAANFDQIEQTDDAREREGIDTGTLDALVRSHRETFGAPLPHPKMDEAARAAFRWMQGGEKSLIFVRRVRSVDELTAKVAHDYDRDLLARLRAEVPATLHPNLEACIVARERQRRGERLEGTRLPDEDLDPDLESEAEDEEDPGGDETFFSWFFRGDGTAPHRLGATFRSRVLTQPSSPFSVLLDDNPALQLLGDEGAVRSFAERNAAELQRRAALFYRGEGQQLRAPLRLAFEAWQLATLEILAERGEAEALALYTVWSPPKRARAWSGQLGDPVEHLTRHTWFTELRRHPELRARIWPEPVSGDLHHRVREREVRRLLLGSAIRLGHPLIDLWLTAVQQTNTLEGHSSGVEVGALARAFVQRLLEQPASGAISSRTELEAIGTHHGLIMDVNFSEARDKRLAELTRDFQRRLARQTPVAGMYGGVNGQVVVQFRMPGYPYVLVTTDVLQEGEDLHTFCGRAVHYGICAMSSGTEQRTGRVDRIGSLLHRRFSDRQDPDLALQVHYPHLADTVERLQVRTLYQRMNTFLEMLHDGFEAGHREETRLNVDDAMLDDDRLPAPPTMTLQSAFDVDPSLLTGKVLAGPPLLTVPEDLLDRLLRVAAEVLRLDLETQPTPWLRLGRAFVAGGELLPPGQHRPGERRQPFRVELRTRGTGDGLLLRVTSPVGVIRREHPEHLTRVRAVQRELIGCSVLATPDDRGTYNLAVRADLPWLLDAPAEALVTALVQVCLAADRLEDELLDTDKDLPVFREQLRAEDDHGHT
jgi:hypothetical protein